MRATEVAFDVVERFGWLVFPIKYGTKKPHTINGLKDASRDPAQLQKWVAQYGEPLNWAVVGGLESGVGIIDIDGPEGENWFEQHWFEPGIEITTPSGGKHIYYSLDGETEYKSTIKKMHHEVDTRIEGAYALLPGGHTNPTVGGPSCSLGDYVGEFPDEIPELPEALAEIIPRVAYRPGDDGDDEKVYYDTTQKPFEASLGEERVLVHIRKMLDDLPRTWRKGAGYHDVMFNAACWLWAIVQSPEYALTERQAQELYLEHSPTTNPPELADIRWNEARKKADGHPAEPPGDVPPLLNPQDVLDPEKHKTLDDLFYSLKKRKDLDILLREARRCGLTEQEAYSLATAAPANDQNQPQWGRTRRIYSEVPDDAELNEDSSDYVIPSEDSSQTEQQKAETRSLRGKFLTDAERDAVNRTPNFIDLYVEAAKRIYNAPNLPLVYMNAWMALSAMGAEHGYLAEEAVRRPLTLFCLQVADSGAGKGDASAQLTGTLKAYPEGLGTLSPFGRKPSTEAAEKAIIERNGKSALLMVDEAQSMLESFHSHRQTYMSGMYDIMLYTYDGSITQSARVGLDDSEKGKTVAANLSVWLQGTWKGITGALTEADIESGFIGRFIPAIGWGSSITEESLRMRFADEYQVAMGGDNPIINALGNELAEVFRDTPPGGYAMVPANREVEDRYHAFRVDVLRHIRKHPMSKELEPISTRLTVTTLRAACLIALSNGRSRIEMNDLLIAMKSTEYWLGDILQLCSAVVSGDLRKKVNRLVELIAKGPISESKILRSPYFNNLDKGEIERLCLRAEAEGSIERDKRSNKWQIRTAQK